MSVWQNIDQMGNDNVSSPTPAERTFTTSGFETNIPQNAGFEDVFLNEDGFEQRQRAGREFIGIANDVKPSLASLVVSMANGIDFDILRYGDLTYTNYILILYQPKLGYYVTKPATFKQHLSDLIN